MVRELVKKCAICIKIKARAANQRMANLPDFRVLDSSERLSAFHTTGIDCAGPFLTMQGRGKPRLKRYLLIFTCAQYRAVHAEMINSLDTASFLLALSRFFPRRGRPKRIISDNGRNFVRGEKELQELWKLIEDPAIKERYPEIEWVFNTPKCPHSGGIFERMIQSFKLALYGIVGKADLNDEQMNTAFCVVEGLLNSRPISYVSSDANDPQPLTPAHFLSISPELDVAPVPKTGFDSKWHDVQKIMDSVWRRFIKECLSRLHRLPKWNKERESPKPGDVVVLLEEKDRGFWPLARVIEVTKSRDGLVRSIEVLVAGRTVLKRPIHTIIPLVSGEGTAVDFEQINRTVEEVELDSDARAENG